MGAVSFFNLLPGHSGAAYWVLWRVIDARDVFFEYFTDGCGVWGIVTRVNVDDCGDLFTIFCFLGCKGC